MALLSGTFHFAPAGGGIPRPATAWRAGAVPASLCFPGKGRRQGAKGRLRLCRSAPGDGWTTTPRCPGDLIPPERWWERELRPEDLVEPTGKGVEELKAIRDALLREPLEPVSLAVREVVATGGNVFRCQCFHVGVLSGPLLLVAGLCKLYTVAPNLFMDIVLGYVFYKLSVLEANLKRNGRANDICARMQFVLLLILIVKRNNPIKDSYYHFTEFFWGNAFQVYGGKVYCKCVGLEHPRQELEALFKAIMSFFKKILKTMWHRLMMKG